MYTYDIMKQAHSYRLNIPLQSAVLYYANKVYVVFMVLRIQFL